MGAVFRNYPRPAGYSYPAAVANLAYKPWNGSLISPSPARQRVGATQTYSVASVPADLSTFILNAPNGQSYTFQFVYNASVQTLGIKIPLPLSGASTAAQVRAQIASILGLSGGIPIGGSFISFPWAYLTTDATHFQIQWNVAGTVNAATGTQATITQSATVASFFGLAAVLPARRGKAYAWLHGV